MFPYAFADEKARPIQIKPTRTKKPKSSPQSSGKVTSRKQRNSHVSKPRLIMITIGRPVPLLSVRSEMEKSRPISNPPSMIPASPYLKYQEPTSPCATVVPSSPLPLPLTITLYHCVNGSTGLLVHSVRGIG